MIGGHAHLDIVSSKGLWSLKLSNYCKREQYHDPTNRGTESGQISTNESALLWVWLLLPVLFTVGALCCLEPAGGVRLEVLPQTRTGGEPLPTGLAPVRFVPGVDTLVIGQVPL